MNSGGLRGVMRGGMRSMLCGMRGGLCGMMRGLRTMRGMMPPNTENDYERETLKFKSI